MDKFFLERLGDDYGQARSRRNEGLRKYCGIFP